MLALYLHIRNLLAREEGQDLIEYALLAGLIALVAVLAITAAGGSVQTIWANIQAALGDAATNATTGG